MLYSGILLSVFLAALIAIGIWGMRRTATLDDYFLGGRSIGPWISALAYGTTYFSAVLFVGFAGQLGWNFGINALWIALGNSICGALGAWLILGKRTRRMTQNLDVMTMPEFLHERFEGRAMKMIAAMVIFVFLLPYSASVFKGLGHLFEAVFHMNYETALLIMIGITGIYLVLGGYFAVTLTDFVQGIIMFAGAIVMVIVLAGKAGGMGAAVHGIIERYATHIPPGQQPSLLLLAALVFMTSFGTWGLPQMVQKFYAVKSESVIRTAAYVTAVFSIVITFAAYFTGALNHVFYDAPIMGPKGPDWDRMIPDLLTHHLPAPLLALIFLLVVSASMSTLASLVLVSASSIAIDLYKGHLNPEATTQTSLFMMRFLSGTFIAISYFIARFEFGIIVTLMSLSWGVVAGTFLAPYVYALFWRRTTLLGAKAGMATGAILAIALFFKLGPANSPIASSIAMIVPFAVVPIVSMMTKRPSNATIRKAFKNI